MNTWFAKLTVCVSLLLMSSFALSQQSDNGAVTTPNNVVSMPVQGLPNVQSIDILKQNQAERTKVQPGNLSPVYRQVNGGIDNYSSLPALEAGVLIQPKAQFVGQSRATTAGEAWRQYRDGPLTNYGGWFIALAVIGIAIFYLVVGQIKLKNARTDRLIERFTSIERLVHWTVAISFLTLALTGLTLLFGRYIVLPLFGHDLFGWLAYGCKNIHNFVGPIFTVALVVMFVIFVKDNFLQWVDWQWIKQLGGARGHASAGRFNAGEKLWFWGGVVLLGLIVSASGFVLNMLVPGILYTRGNMQIAHIIHLIAAVLVFSVALGHIYIGTLGMEGAYEAMATGFVDDEWAREHHDLWYEDIQSGKEPRIRTEEGAMKAGEPVRTV